MEPSVEEKIRTLEERNKVLETENEALRAELFNYRKNDADSARMGRNPTEAEGSGSSGSGGGGETLDSMFNAHLASMGESAAEPCAELALLLERLSNSKTSEELSLEWLHKQQANYVTRDSQSH